MNETELVERCGKGDNLARKQLYERYAGQLMAICVRYTGDREVAQDAAMYWTKDDGNLAQLIDDCENIDREQIGNKAKERIKTAYSWEFISERYNQIWNT